MNNFIPINQLKIDSNLFNFVNTEILPGIDIQQDQFWKNFSIGEQNKILDSGRSNNFLDTSKAFDIYTFFSF